VERGEPLAEVPGVTTRENTAAPVLRRLPLIPPARDSLPALENYARLATGDEMRLAGYVEASRGCLHTCRHCPITPVYGGRFFVLPRETVLADIRAQVAAGARHITFGDPDFMNGPKRSMDLVRTLHDEFPDVTFDATIKVEHILERRDYFADLAGLGCAFVVSAVESLSEEVLRHLAKGHTRADVVEALNILDAAGIPMRPTFVAFTPWTTASDYLDVLDFIAEHGLVEHVDPIQYAIRLLVPPSSALLDDPDGRGWLGPLDEEALSYTWQHPDPRMDTLQREAQALVERAASQREPIAVSFAAIRRLAAERLDAREPALVGAGVSDTTGAMRQSRRPIPHLSEPWFC
ncbi:MAG TPA: radical SAM protein, partial [Ktedonobacterales bacterium]|nr:radical SAM protein [Ktedonobacterales bacterium]